MFISIVVPVYNVADYLHYAIESLIKQTYQNFEIILVMMVPQIILPYYAKIMQSNMKISMFSTKKMVDYLMHVILEWQKQLRLDFLFRSG